MAAAFVVTACGNPDRSAVGIVAALDAPGGHVDGFTLRTGQGETIPFVIGTLESGGDAFPAAHLAEHAATLAPIVVTYRVENGRNVAHRLFDAPVPSPTP